MGELCPLAFCRLDPHIRYPEVASLQKTLGLTHSLILPPDSLHLPLINPTRVLRTPPWRLVGGWIRPLPLVQPRADYGMHVLVMVLCDGKVVYVWRNCGDAKWDLVLLRFTTAVPSFTCMEIHLHFKLRSLDLLVVTMSMSSCLSVLLLVPLRSSILALRQRLHRRFLFLGFYLRKCTLHWLRCDRNLCRHFFPYSELLHFTLETRLRGWCMLLGA